MRIGPPGPTPHPFRVRVFKGSNEVLHGRQYLAALDLTKGPRLRATAAQLDELLYTLATNDGARGEQIRAYYLQVEDWPQGRVVCHWPATTTDGEGP